MPAPVAHLLKKLTRMGITRGTTSGGIAWIVIGVSAFILQRALRKEKPVQTITLKPGNSVTISVKESNPSS